MCNYLDKDLRVTDLVYLSLISVATSTRSRNHFNSQQYKAAQSISLHFLQNSPLVQLYTSASDCKGAEKTSLQAIL